MYVAWSARRAAFSLMFLSFCGHVSCARFSFGARFVF